MQRNLARSRASAASPARQPDPAPAAKPSRLTIVSDDPGQATRFARTLVGIFAAEVVGLDKLRRVDLAPFIVVDVDLAAAENIRRLRTWLDRRQEDATVAFCVDPNDRRQEVQAYALGATVVSPRPVSDRDLLSRLLGEPAALLAEAPIVAANNEPGIASGIGALRNIFAAASLGGPLDAEVVAAAAGSVVDNIAGDGLGHWIAEVRRYHSQTYQHCLIVTGVATAFAVQLGASRTDQQRLALAGLLHDIGKARIPLAILDKPGPLDAAELAVMRQHPLLGLEALRGNDGIDAAMLDMVVHHHEYLDGSGYPHGLQARELSDLVRMMTVADIFGALIERRSYKPPLSGEAAYDILAGMGPKLDADLVREFRPISRMSFSNR